MKRRAEELLIGAWGGMVSMDPLLLFARIIRG